MIKHQQILGTLILGAIILFSSFAYSQRPNLWVEGQSNIVELENEGFEAGLGSFTNSGSVNWTTTNSITFLGNYSATSNTVFSGQSAILERIITVPAGYTAMLSFGLKTVINLGVDGSNSSYYTFKIDGTNQDYSTVSDGWITKSYYLTEGTHTLQFGANSSNFSDDNISVYLDRVLITFNETPTIRIADGSEGFGKVLMSDEVGNASWQRLSAGSVGNSSLNGIVPLILDGNDISLPFTVSNADAYGITSYGNDLVGIFSTNNHGTGISSRSNEGDGVISSYNGGEGISSSNNDGDGIRTTNNVGDGIYSQGNGVWAGYFVGNVFASFIQKGGGTFKIDHPIDPENKFLSHSFVESPDMMNVYNGNIILDAQGEAVVKMEDWFEPLNKEFRYQLTAIGAPGPNLYIAEKLQNNQFKIAGGSPRTEVSWQVTGIRQDPFANKNRVVVEEEKSAKHKGYYLHPDAYDMPFEKSFDFVKNGHKTLKELKAEAEAKAKPER